MKLTDEQAVEIRARILALEGKVVSLTESARGALWAGQRDEAFERLVSADRMSHRAKELRRLLPDGDSDATH